MFWQFAKDSKVKEKQPCILQGLNSFLNDGALSDCVKEMHF